MFSRCVCPCHVWLGTPARHAAAAALALGPIGSAISAHARAVVASYAVFVAVVIAIVWCNAWSVHAGTSVADATIAADQTAISIAATVGTMFNTAIAADEAVIAIRATVGAMLNTTVAAD
jgi:hypothetical protein